MKLKFLCLMFSFAAVLNAAPADAIHVDATVSNTAAVNGLDPWRTGSETTVQPEAGSQTWNERVGFGFDAENHRAIFESRESEASTTLQTTITNLVPGKFYNIYVDYMSASNSNWTVLAGTSATDLNGFALQSVTLDNIDYVGVVEGSDVVTNLGVSSTPGSNRYQLRAFIGVLPANFAGEITVYAGAATVASANNRVWYDGIAYEEATPAKGASSLPYPQNAMLVNKDSLADWNGSLSWQAPADEEIAAITGYDVYTYVYSAGEVVDPNGPVLALVSTNQSGTSFPVTLEYGDTYFWRVDTHVTWTSTEVTGNLTDVIPSFGWTFEVLPNDATPIVTTDTQIVTSLDFTPTVSLVATVDDNDENDIVSVTWAVTDYIEQYAVATMQMQNKSADPGVEAVLSGFDDTRDMLVDWIGTDTRSMGDPMVLTIKGLPAGDYTWKSYHHDPYNQTGQFDVTLYDANGSAFTPDLDITDANVLPICTFETSIKSDGSDVNLVFDQQPYDGQVTDAFFIMNAFELVGTSGSLFVDFGNIGDVPEDGYLAYEATNEVEATFTEQDFAAFGTTVSVLPTWGGYGDSDVVDTTNDTASSSQTAEFNARTTGKYVVELEVVDAASQATTKTISITVMNDACSMSQSLTGWAGFNAYDFNEDCIVDLADFAIFADQWLADLRSVSSVSIK